MAISLMLPATNTTVSAEGSPASLPPPTPLSPTEPYPPPPPTANSTTSSNNENGNTNANASNNGAKPAAPANATEKRKTSRRANTAERRATHNAVERQRRETLNGRFLDLAALLPNLTSVRRPSKSAIVNSSIALIHAQRRQRATAARELRTLYSQFLLLKAECDEWRLRSGVPPVEDGERSKEFISLIELREEEEMGEEERGALRMAMSATANGGAGGSGGMRDDDDDDDLVVPHVSNANAGPTDSSSDSEQYVHQAQTVQHTQVQAQAQAQAQAQVQAQVNAQAQYHQMRARASTFSHPQGVPSTVHGHGHHPYATAYHAIPRPGSHGSLPPHPTHLTHLPHHGHGPHTQPHGGHVLPFDNGSDLILASEPHLPHGPFGTGIDIFSTTGSNPHTPAGVPHSPNSLEMIYGHGATTNMIPGHGADFKANEWANAANHHYAHPHPHPGMIPSHSGHGGYGGLHTPFDDSASSHSSSTGTGPISTSSGPVGGVVNEGASPRSHITGSPLGSVHSGGRSRAGSMVSGVENVNLNGKGIGVGGGSLGGNAVMSMFF